MFSRRLDEVESLMDRVENDAKEQVEVASSKFHEKASEASSLRLENERLKVNRFICTCKTSSLSSSL